MVFSYSLCASRLVWKRSRDSSILLVSFVLSMFFFFFLPGKGFWGEAAQRSKVDTRIAGGEMLSVGPPGAGKSLVATAVDAARNVVFRSAIQTMIPTTCELDADIFAIATFRGQESTTYRHSRIPWSGLEHYRTLPLPW